MYEMFQVKSIQIVQIHIISFLSTRCTAVVIILHFDYSRLALYISEIFFN